MHVLILGNQSDSPNIDENEYYAKLVEFFSQAVKEENIKVAYTLFSDVLFEINSEAVSVHDTRNDCDLRDYDAVFIRGQFRQRLDVVYVVSRYLRRYRRLVINDYSHARTSSKLSQAYTFFELGTSTPYTVCGSKKVLETHLGKLQMPFICKEVYGAHGNNNHLLKTEAQLQEVLQGTADQLYVLQNFVQNDGDYRLLCIGRRHLIIKRTAAPSTHLNNTSQGGHAELLPADALPPEVIEQARRCIESLGMTTAGVDIIRDKLTGSYLFLEINSQPQLLTGAFTDEKQRLMGLYLKDLAADRA